MKKPYLNREQRQMIIWHEKAGQYDSFTGAALKFNLELKKCCKEIQRALRNLPNNIFSVKN